MWSQAVPTLCCQYAGGRRLSQPRSTLVASSARRDEGACLAGCYCGQATVGVEALRGLRGLLVTRRLSWGLRPQQGVSRSSLMLQFATWVTLLVWDPGSSVLSPPLPHSGQPAFGGSREAQPEPCLPWETTMNDE